MRVLGTVHHRTHLFIVLAITTAGLIFYSNIVQDALFYIVPDALYAPYREYEDDASSSLFYGDSVAGNGLFGIQRDAGFRDRLVSDGELNQQDFRVIAASDNPCINVVYTWANGSDPIYQHILSSYQDSSPVFEGMVGQVRRVRWEKRGRDHGELRYSLRTIMRYLGQHNPIVHIVSSDFNLDSATMLAIAPDAAIDQRTTSHVDANGSVNYKLIPSWLQQSDNDKDQSLKLLVPSQFYQPASAPPVFNSRAYETQIHNLPMERQCGFMDSTLYLNDDMFLSNYHDPADWMSTIAGININLAAGVLVDYRQVKTSAVNEGDEWASLFFTNNILSKRFGMRPRAYVEHFSRVVSREIIREMAEAFPQEFADTSSMRFRGEGNEINTAYMHHHYVIERHREVLINSFIQLRSDTNEDGFIDREELEQMIELLKYGEEEEEEEKEGIKKPTRQQVVIANLLKQTVLAQHQAKRSKFIWSSLVGGHPFAIKLRSVYDLGLINQAAHHDVRIGRTERKCNSTVLFDACFRAAFGNFSAVSSAELADRVARKFPACGDCLLDQIGQTSDSFGLRDFLPFEGHPRRDQVIEQLYRYSYTMSSVLGEFVMATSAEQAMLKFKRVVDRPVNQICVNDDVESNNNGAADKLTRLLEGFLDGYFPNATQYECDGVSRGSMAEASIEGSRFWRKVGRVKPGP